MAEPFFESQATIKVDSKQDQKISEELMSQDVEIMELQKQIEDQEMRIDDAPSDVEGDSSDHDQSQDLKDELAKLEQLTAREQAKKAAQEQELDLQVKQITQESKNITLSHQASVKRLKNDFEQSQQNIMNSVKSSFTKVTKSNESESFQTRLDQDPQMSLRGGHIMSDLKSHFLKTIEAKQEEIDKLQQQVDQEKQKCDEIQAKVAAKIAERQKIAMEQQKEIDELESEIKAQTEVQTSRQKAVQKLKSVISGHKDQIKSVTSQRLESVADSRWKGNIMVGLFILVIGYMFPKFVEVHYGQIQWLVDHLWKLFKNAKSGSA